MHSYVVSRPSSLDKNESNNSLIFVHYVRNGLKLHHNCERKRKSTIYVATYNYYMLQIMWQHNYVLHLEAVAENGNIIEFFHWAL